MSVNLTGIIAEAERLRGFPAKAGQAVSRAKGTLRRRIVVEARRDIQTEYNLPATRINKNLGVTDDGEAVVLTGYARAIGLIEFAGKWSGVTSGGAVAAVFAGGGGHEYAGTFIATGKSGNRQIFERTTKKRLPIRTLYGPSVASMLRKGDRIDRLGDFAQNLLSTEIARLL